MPTRDQVDAVVFDYGGVLTTPLSATTGSWLRADGIDPDGFATLMRDWLGRDAEPGNPIHLLETGELDVPEFERRFADRLVTTSGAPVPAAGVLTRLFAAMKPSDEMTELVRDLRKLGLRTGLLSNSWGNDYPHHLLAELCDVIVISGEVGLRKPDEPIYRLLLDRLELPAERVVFVDDFTANVRAAQAIGMHGIRHVDPASTRAALAELLGEAL
ncbi:HAD family hydrolase [Kutzneria kofuensis]|uniref:Putative hydrolase of the HAD superfamily n=1 Tax=Kutzneria kofuensis TaxID=103725 RepID=A0A7W9NMD9_9PSEU|nr:HAD family phosphatase [Kutzneria kofuensis]MBB5897744.1 putative hydrolase of the HAD superfamily [Kutzneria kofuensis]